MREVYDSNLASTKSENFANIMSASLDSWSRDGSRNVSNNHQETITLVNKGVLPDASNLLQSLAQAQTTKASEHAHLNHNHHHHQGHEQNYHAHGDLHHGRHQEKHGQHHEAHTDHRQHGQHHEAHTDHGQPGQHHEAHTDHGQPGQRHEAHSHLGQHHEAGSELQHGKHHETHAEHVAKIRKEIDEHIKYIQKHYANAGDRIVLIATELGKDPERWKSPDGHGKCNAFVEATLKAAGVELPWKEGGATAQGMMNAMLKDKAHFDVAYQFHNETNEQFHEKYIPKNGDVIVWYKNGVEHIGIVEETFDKRGNILTAGVHEHGKSGHANGYAHFNLDWYTGSQNYGPPSYVFRSKN